MTTSFTTNLLHVNASAVTVTTQESIGHRFYTNSLPLRLLVPINLFELPPVVKGRVPVSNLWSHQMWEIPQNLE